MRAFLSPAASSVRPKSVSSRGGKPVFRVRVRVCELGWCVWGVCEYKKVGVSLSLCLGRSIPRLFLGVFVYNMY